MIKSYIKNYNFTLGLVDFKDSAIHNMFHITSMLIVLHIIIVIALAL